MIISFRDGEAEKIFHNEVSRKFPPDIQSVALRKLLQLHASVSLHGLSVPRGNRLEALKGSRLGAAQHSRQRPVAHLLCLADRRRRKRIGGWGAGRGTGGLSLTAGNKEIRGDTRKIMERLPNIRPGEVLQKDFLDELGVTPYRPAKDIGVGRMRVSEILRGKRDITPDTAIRLGLYFGVEPEFWLNLQAHYNLVEARLANADDYNTVLRRVHMDAAA